MRLLGRLPRRLATIEKVAVGAATLAIVAMLVLALTACGLGGRGGSGGGGATTFPPPKVPPAPAAQELSFAQQAP